MKVLLIEPPIAPFDVPTGLVGLPEPLALESVAAPLCLNHDVTIFDMRIEPDKLAYRLQEIQPDAVAIGAVTANLHMSKAVLKSVKSFRGEILTLIGGHHVSLTPQDAMEPYIDVVIIGEGDESTKLVIDSYEVYGKKEILHYIKGIAVNENGRQILTEKAPLIHMDTLLKPARHLTDHYRNDYFTRTERPVFCINSSRGCTSRCSFCMLWKVNRGKYRTRNAGLIVEEMAELDGFIEFIDDNTLSDTVRAHQIADILITGNLKKRFKMFGRADTIVKHPRLIEKLAKAGLEQLLVGFETVNDNALEHWRKQCTADVNTKAIHILNANNIRAVAYFLVSPTFKQHDFNELSAYIETMKLTDPIFTILIPFHGTDLYNEVKDRIIVKDYRFYDFFHTVFDPRLPLDEFYDEFSKLYQRAYSPDRDAIKKITLNGGGESEAHVERFRQIFERIHNLKYHHGPN